MTPIPAATIDGVDVQAFAGDHQAGDLAITNTGLANRARRMYFASPLLVWAHNNRRPAIEDLDAARQVGNVTLLTNTAHMADVYLSVLGIRSLVLHPPVTLGTPQKPGHAVTMVNLNRDKGSDVFWDLAAAHPGTPFIGVRGGHGAQDVRAAANVTITEHGDLEPVWARTRTLLLPSLHESYSMVGVEAASRGIPTLARDLPGVREALGDGAVYVADDDWDGGLKTIDADWTTHSRAAVTHSRTVDTAAELAAACDLAERIV
jgi:glycosyltransferase involved in cell wall biosynthesis